MFAISVYLEFSAKTKQMNTRQKPDKQRENYNKM